MAKDPTPGYRVMPKPGATSSVYGDLSQRPAAQDAGGTKKKGTLKERFLAWAKKTGATPKAAADLYYWGKKYKVDPYFWTAVLKDQGQLTGNIDPNQAKALGEAIKLRGYEGVYPSERLKAIVPKGMIFSPSHGAPAEEIKEKAIQENDTWVTGINSQGKLRLVVSENPPKNALRYDGMPMTQSDFVALKNSLEQTYVSYTGKRPSNAQTLQFLQKGWSEYTLQNLLSKAPGFKQSPLYKARAPEYQAVGKGLFAKGDSDPELLRQAIVNNWDQNTYQAQVRKREGYVKSQEFVGREATLASVYTSIYGDADALSQNVIKEAALGGWDTPQFAAWLRAQDEYVYTNEYRAKATSLVEQLGFLTGKVATLTPTKRKQRDNQAPSYGPLPDDPRLKGKPKLPAGTAFVPGTR